MIARSLILGLLLLLGSGLNAQAQELSWSGFGTAGYARSDQALTYQRFITDDGSFKRDSLIGGQADLRFSPQWSATVQLKLTPSIQSDTRWDVVPTWAFVAFRPADDWLLRAGKMRVPLYLHSESMDVGNTYEFARLPTEMYGLVPSTDFAGVSAAKTWSLGDKDLSLDVYSGEIGSTVRFWMRDGAPPEFVAGANFLDVKVRSTGAVLTLRSARTTGRIGLHRTRTRLSNGQSVASDYPFVEIAPGVGYYQVSDALPGPGVPSTPTVHNTVLTVGLDHELLPTWRVAAEFTRNVQSDTQVGFDSRGSYIAVLHAMGRYTPYLSWAQMKASEKTIDVYERLTRTRLPSFVPGADLINQAQRAAGESSYAVDQQTWAIGSSYAIDPNQKLKLEWAQTRVGRLSRFLDTPPGQETPNHVRINVWSASYSFSF